MGTADFDLALIWIKPVIPAPQWVFRVRPPAEGS
jgi:hypothetical protein